MISTIYNNRIYRDTKFINKTYLHETVEHLLVKNLNLTLNSKKMILLQETLLLVQYISDQLQELEGRCNTSFFRCTTLFKFWMSFYFKATLKGRWYAKGLTGLFSWIDPSRYFLTDIKLHADIKNKIKTAFNGTYQCPQPVCPAGWRPNFGTLLVGHNLHPYKQGFGWTCRKCPIQTIKTRSRNTSCKACPLYTISTADRTKCIDPYKKMYLKSNQIETLFCILSAIICCAVAMIISAIFIRARNTLIGKSVDLKLTFIQLISIASIYISFVSLYVGEPSYCFCSNCANQNTNSIKHIQQFYYNR